jgi:hypothetical protein
MKRHVSPAIVLLTLSLWLPPAVRAQNPVATAAREETLANIQNMAARIERLEEANHAYQLRIEKLERENFRLRDELERQKNRSENAATLEKITRLQEAIKQVDRARQDDNKKVYTELSRLRAVLERAAKGLASSPPPDSDRPASAASSSPASRPPRANVSRSADAGQTRPSSAPSRKISP